MTTGFLAEIVRDVRGSLESPTYDSGLPETAPRRPGSFRKSIVGEPDRGALVVEFKRFSPGRTDPALPVRSAQALVRAARPAGVAAYSCIATGPVFHGAPNDVREVVLAAQPAPVLFKDFVVDDRQLDAAVRAGASAVLLIARLETEGHLKRPIRELADGARKRGLEVVLEYHDRAELSEVADVVPDVYGVNTRNLDTLVIDRGAAKETLREASRRGYRPLLGLSGIESAADAEELWKTGVDGLLVGSAVARASDPTGFLASLHRPGGGLR